MGLHIYIEKRRETSDYYLAATDTNNTYY